MKLFLDPTTDNQLTIGISEGKRFVMQTVEVPRGRHEMVLIEIDRILSKKQKKVSDIDSIGVVSGPGRFSSLRVASTIANVFSMAQKVKLYAMPAQQGVALDPSVVFQTKNKVAAIKPAYGKPPSITAPRKQILRQFT